MSSLLPVSPSNIVARLAAGNLKSASVSEIRTLLTLTDAGVKTAYENNGNTNAFTDAFSSKLTGIEALADVTDEANVTVALNGASPGTITPALGDLIYLQDITDTNNLKLATIATILALSTGATKNLLFNGNFDIWQRGTTFTGAVNIYTADRWAWRDIGAGVVDILRSTDTPDNLSDFSLHVDVTTADGTLGTTDFYGVEYRVEGQDAIPLAAGTSDAVEVTVSFWVKSAKTGIHSVAFQNSAIDRSYVAEYTVAVADTWEEKSVTLTLDTTGTWLTDTGIGLSIIFALASGPDRDTTPGSWQAGDFKASTNQVNVMDNAANNFRLSRVQLEIAGTPGIFATRPFPEELALCKRYFQKTFAYAVTPAQAAGNKNVVQYIAFRIDANANIISWELPVQLRIEPHTLVFFSPGSANDTWRSSGATDSGTASSIASQTSDSRIAILNPQAIGDAVGDQLFIHATVDSEL